MDNGMNKHLSSELFSALLDGIDDELLILDEDHNAVMCNKSFADDFYMGISAVDGKNYSEIFPDYWNKILNEVLAEETEEEIEKEVEDFDGERVYSLRMKTSGKFILIFIRDISELKNSEDEVRRYIEELQFNTDIFEKNVGDYAQINAKLAESEKVLQNLNLLKDKILSSLDFDIRTPLNVLIGYSDLISSHFETLSKDEIEDISRHVDNSSASLSGNLERIGIFLESLLLWSQYSGKDSLVELEKLQLKNFIDDQTNLYKKSSKLIGIEIVNNVPIDKHVQCNKKILSNVIGSLILSTYHFGVGKGRITFSYDDENFSLKTTFGSFKNELSEEELETIRKEFTKAEPSLSENKFGISLTKALLEKCGGKMDVSAAAEKVEYSLNL